MLITFGVHLYEKCTKKCIPYLSGIFSKLCSNKKNVTMVSKHTLVQISLDPWLNGKYMLPNKKGGQLFPPPSIFKSREGNCPQLFRPWSGISEVRTTDSYGASEFMSVRIFSCLCVSIFSFLGIRNILSAIKYLSFCHVIPVYLYHILLLRVPVKCETK